MRLGVHVRTGCGLGKAIGRAGRLGCEAIQIFASNPNSWQVGNLNQKEAGIFQEGLETFGITPVVLHTPYLLNLASSKDDNWNNSWRALASALERAETLGAGYIVTHIGSHGGVGFEIGADKVREAVLRALDFMPSSAMVLLEGGSGAGNTIGSTFDQQAELLSRLENRRDRVGICLDTAHLWGAGYDLSSADKANAVLADFDRIVGFSRLKVVHCNDTQKDLGSHADRHWHIGKGQIGIEGFQAIINHPALADITGILETPESENDMDQINLDTLKSLRIC